MAMANSNDDHQLLVHSIRLITSLLAYVFEYNLVSLFLSLYATESILVGLRKFNSFFHQKSMCLRFSSVQVWGYITPIEKGSLAIFRIGFLIHARARE